MFEEMNAALMAETSPAVQIWMNWMMLVFLASVFFLKNHRVARWVLITIVATMIGAILIWMMTKNVHLFGIAHLILWAPLAIYLWKTVLSKQAKTNMKQYRVFFIWVCLLFATILISLVFDVRDIYLVMTGQK